MDPKLNYLAGQQDPSVRHLLNRGTPDLQFAFSEEARNFAAEQYQQPRPYYVVDKPSQSLIQVNPDGTLNLIGRVGLGRNVGDRDVSGGRATGANTNQTQSGWTRINRLADFNTPSDNYGRRFHGFESYVPQKQKWLEVPTGIHGTGHEPVGRVSGGCTRLDGCIEDEMLQRLRKGDLFYYTSDGDTISNKNGYSYLNGQGR